MNRLAAFEPVLGKALGVGLRGEYALCYLSNHPMAMTDPANWPQAYEWLERQEEHFSNVLSAVVVGV